MKTHNPNCDGAHCHKSSGEVRKWKIGGGANDFLCYACWTYANRYNKERGNEPGQDPMNWVQQDWNNAEIYAEEGGCNG